MALSTAWEWSGRKWPKEVEVTRVTRLSSAGRPSQVGQGFGWLDTAIIHTQALYN